jgi:hypothetical protein
MRRIGHDFATSGFEGRVLKDNVHELSSTSERQRWSPSMSNPLLEYFQRRSHGAGIWKWRHYFDIYHQHFQKFVGTDVVVVEVGVYSGGSLGMWRSYFGSDCRVYGVDIQPACKQYEMDGVQVLTGDQADREFWCRFRASVPRVDILIDDGGHHVQQQRITLEENLPHLAPGGVYLCEDIHGNDNGFSAFVTGLVEEMHHFQPDKAARFNPDDDAETASAASSFQRYIQSIHIYPFCCVIQRHTRPVSYFAAPKQGTEWQPFYDRPAT